MSAAKRNIYIEQGATFCMLLSWKQDGVPVDLTGYMARMQVRENFEDAVPQISITSEADEIVLGADGSIAISIPAQKTSAATAISGYYDLEVEDVGGTVTRLLQGSVTLSQEATK